ncbi:putative mitochondrial cytochrome b2 [Atractiella rhizophila]|nr:putative mitochondrial cytochrome b2 [Atractiella rhizophila]
MLDGKDVATHNTRESCWIVISGKAYDVTKFLDEHPGGANILLKYGGMDATEEYDPIHPPGTIDTLPKDCHLGPVDPATLKKPAKKEDHTVQDDDEIPLGSDGLPALSRVLNIEDIEKCAKRVLKKKAWAYYYSAADDMRTRDYNHTHFHSIRFRPRVLTPTGNCTPATKILGFSSSLPLFISPAALGRLAHPDGEKCLARGAGRMGIPYVISNNASVSPVDVASVATSDQTLFFQLYINANRKSSEELLKKVEEVGYKAVVWTVDAIAPGNREIDERAKFMDEAVDVDTGAMNTAKTDAPRSVNQAMFSSQDSNLVWEDLKWIRKHTKLPIVVKGIQSAEDAELCARWGVAGIFLSNHGGRQLEGAPSSVETLLEIRKHCPWVFKKCEVYCDGGFRRGTDVVMALCLGAKACGIGRPAMNSLIWGDAGVEKCIGIFAKEIVVAMKLLGVSTVEELGPQHVNASELERNVISSYQSPPGALTTWLKARL